MKRLNDDELNVWFPGWYQPKRGYEFYRENPEQWMEFVVNDIPYHVPLSYLREYQEHLLLNSR